MNSSVIHVQSINYQCALLLWMYIHVLNTAFAYLSTSFTYSDWLMTKKRPTSRALLGIPPKAAHAVYSVSIESATCREPQNSSSVCFYFLFFPNNTN